MWHVVDLQPADAMRASPDRLLAMSGRIASQIKPASRTARALVLLPGKIDKEMMNLDCCRAARMLDK